MKIQAPELFEEVQKDKLLVVDVRSEDEFQRDPLPGSVNFPILRNMERHRVGYLYKQVDQEKAYQEALACAEPKHKSLKDFITKRLRERQHVAIACWRGGGRSSYVQRIVRPMLPDATGVFQLDGGTKAYRSWVMRDLDNPDFYPTLRTVSGMTGVGKSRLLEHLQQSGRAVVPIEDCARHMSSVFGAIPYEGKTATQVEFEQNVHHCLLLAKRKGETVFVESESRRVGPLILPAIFHERIHEAEHVELKASLELRCEILRQDYIERPKHGLEEVKEKLNCLEKHMNPKLMKTLVQLLEIVELDTFFRFILTDYYDKVYKPFPHAPQKTLSYGSLDELFEQTKDW